MASSLRITRFGTHARAGGRFPELGTATDAGRLRATAYHVPVSQVAQMRNA